MYGVGLSRVQDALLRVKVMVTRLSISKPAIFMKRHSGVMNASTCVGQDLYL